MKANRKYEVLAMLAYGFLMVRPQLQYTTHKKLLEAKCPGQDSSRIVVVA